MKESFVFYASFYQALKELPDAEQLKLYQAISEYALTEKEPDLEGVAKGMFTLIKPQINANNKRYANGCKGAEYGKLGGRPRKNPESEEIKPQNNPEKTPKKPQENGNQTPNENVNVNVNVKEKDTLKSVQKENLLQTDIEDFVPSPSPKPRAPVFIPPTIEQVKAYIAEKSLCVDGERFLQYFEAGDWKDSEGKKVKNWKQKLITWSTRDRTLRAAKSLLPQNTGVRSGSYGEDIPL